jgi:hypothetical protein
LRVGSQKANLLLTGVRFHSLSLVKFGSKKRSNSRQPYIIKFSIESSNETEPKCELFSQGCYLLFLIFYLKFSEKTTQIDPVVTEEHRKKSKQNYGDTIQMKSRIISIKNDQKHLRKSEFEESY